jgi:hypothetical protein
MKQIVLAVTFLLFSFATFAQTKENGNCYGCGGNSGSYNSSYHNQDNTTTTTIDLKVFPNPTSDFIGLNDNDEVSQISIFNLVGKKMKTFNYSKGETYNVSDLPDGLYLVQLFSKQNGKIITTQRLSKR